MVGMFPFQILALTIHMQLYKLSLVYNSYCLEETERAWKWGNIYEKETLVCPASYVLPDTARQVGAGSCSLLVFTSVVFCPPP